MLFIALVMLETLLKACKEVEAILCLTIGLLLKAQPPLKLLFKSDHLDNFKMVQT